MRFFQISTGSPGGTYFAVGQTLAAAISRPPGAEPCEEGGPCGVSGLIAIAKAAPGSIANVRNVNNGKIDSALAQADIAAWAYRGERMFKSSGGFDRLRAIASLYPEALHLVASKSANIRSIEDLSGKRVSIGTQGSGTRSNALLILRSFGVSRSQLKLFDADAPRAADMILAGELDAFFIMAGTPVAVVSDLTERGAVDLVPIQGKPVLGLLKDNRFFLPHTISAGIYPGVDSIGTVSVQALWVASAQTSDSVIHEVTAALWNKQNRRVLDQGHTKTKLMTLKSALAGLPIPLHDGAKAYYRGVGSSIE